MRAAMAILAVGRGRSAGLVGLGMKTMGIRRLRIGMALRAGYLLRRLLMHQALHILVAIDARQHAAMDGVLEFVAIHKQTDLLAVFIIGQRGIGVAGKTICILEFMFCPRERSSRKQG